MGTGGLSPNLPSITFTKQDDSTLTIWPGSNISFVTEIFAHQDPRNVISAYNQKIKAKNNGTDVSFGANDVVEIVAGTNMNIAADATAKTITLTPNYTTSVTSGSTDLVTSGAVYTAIDSLPEPMIFKGSVGTGGTVEWPNLPSASTSEG